MTDAEKREKIIEGLQKCAAIHQGFICESCEYTAGDCAVDDAFAMLKAQEPIEARLHLCESCTKEYPECDATADGIEFGCGVGNDNVIGCTAYVNRWKAQEPVKPVVDIDTWKCGNCGHTLEHQELLGDNVLLHEQYNFCPECGRAVKWDG